MSVVEILTKISKSMDKLYDFSVSDEFLGADFEKYLEKNEIKIEEQSAFNIVLTQYLLDKKMQSGKRVLDYCATKNVIEKDVLKAFKESFTGVFEIKKISKNSFFVYSLINEREFELISLIKTVNLRGIGRSDFMEARIIEFDNTFYILEIFDLIGSNSFHIAYRRALKMLIKSPKLLCFKNDEKRKKIECETGKIYKDFIDFFGKDKVITTNKLADSLINSFNLYHENKNCSLDKNLIQEPEKYRYFEIFDENDEEHIENALLGFSNYHDVFDVGLFCDSKLGFFTIPFLGTFDKIFENNEIENAANCIFEFLMSDKVPPSAILAHNDGIDKINEVAKMLNIEEFKNMDEVICNFKKDYSENFIVSVATALYNSELFEKYINFMKNVENVCKK